MNPTKLVARVKRLQEEVAAIKELCRDILTQKQVCAPLNPNPKSELFEAKAVLKSLGLTL